MISCRSQQISRCAVWSWPGLGFHASHGPGSCRSWWKFANKNRHVLGVVTCSACYWFRPQHDVFVFCKSLFPNSSFFSFNHLDHLKITGTCWPVGSLVTASSVTGLTFERTHLPAPPWAADEGVKANTTRTWRPRMARHGMAPEARCLRQLPSRRGECPSVWQVEMLFQGQFSSFFSVFLVFWNGCQWMSLISHHVTSVFIPSRFWQTIHKSSSLGTLKHFFLWKSCPFW